MEKLITTLPFVLQFESFPDTIRYYLYKYSENKVMALAYTAGCVIVLVVIYQFLARQKKR